MTYRCVYKPTQLDRPNVARNVNLQWPWPWLCTKQLVLRNYMPLIVETLLTKLAFHTTQVVY